MLNDQDFVPVLNGILYYCLREFVVIHLLAWEILTLDRFQNQLRKKCTICVTFVTSKPIGPEVVCTIALKSYHHLVVHTGCKSHASDEVD